MDRSDRKLRSTKSKQSKQTDHVDNTDHSATLASSTNSIATMIDSDDNESDQETGGDRNTLGNCDSTIQMFKTAASSSPNRNTSEVDNQCAHRSSVDARVQDDATLLTLVDMDKRRREHFECLRKKSNRMKQPIIQRSDNTSVHSDTDLLHAVLKTIGTLSGMAVSAEDMSSKVSLGLYVCRAMRAHSVASTNHPSSQSSPPTSFNADAVNKLHDARQLINEILQSR